jgi:hypothetical protein
VDATVASDEGGAYRGFACPVPENDGGTCSTVEALGPLVDSACSSAEPPQPQGGTIQDGTYVLDSFTYYGGCMPDAPATTTTWVICGDHWDTAERFASADGSNLPPLEINTLATVSGTTVDLAITCLSAGLSFSGFAPRGYTASPGHLMFIYSVTNGTGVSTYTKL